MSRRITEINTPKLTIPIKLALSLGWPTELLILISFELFILFFYTQVLGLSGTLTGAALFLAMCLDGLSDPILGTFSDNLRKARWGRRHTLMFLSPLPLGVFFALVFMPPAFLHGLSLFLWLMITAIGCRVSSALFIIPYSTQVAEMSRDSEVRASLSIYKSIAQTIFQFALIGLSFRFIFGPTHSFANGQENRANYAPFGLIWGGVLAAITTLSSLGTYRYMRAIEAITPLGPKTRTSVSKFLSSWKAALAGNPNVRVVILGAIAMVAATGMARSLASHMGIYFWRLTPGQISDWQQVAIPGTFAGLFLARYLLKLIEMKVLILVGMAMAYFSYAVPPALMLLGLLPPVGNPLIYEMLLAANLIQGVGLGFVVMISGLMSAQTADEEELFLGGPEQGLLYGFVFMATKIGSGLGKLFSGLTLDFIKFPIGKPVGSIGQDVIDQLVWSLIICVVVLGGVSLVIWSRFSISRRRHREITVALEERASEHLAKTEVVVR